MPSGRAGGFVVDSKSMRFSRRESAPTWEDGAKETESEKRGASSFQNAPKLKSETAWAIKQKGGGGILVSPGHKAIKEEN